MASWMVHLRIADKLLDQLKNIDETAFVMGNIAPDSGVPNEDWYDIDFLYLKQHPDFRGFSIYEHAVNFDNEFMSIFAKDAFENRRQYICCFYRNDERGELEREYKYLTPEQAEAFVQKTVEKIQRFMEK